MGEVGSHAPTLPAPGPDRIVADPSIDPQTPGTHPAGPFAGPGTSTAARWGSGLELPVATVAESPRLDGGGVSCRVHNVERRRKPRPNSTLYSACVYNVERTGQT